MPDVFCNIRKDTLVLVALMEVYDMVTIGTSCNSLLFAGYLLKVLKIPVFKMTN